MTGHAVVLGAGIGGLITAAVLAERFSTVSIVERDRLPDTPIDRRGVTQGRHLHSLLSRGSQIIEELLPGFLADLGAAGALVLDDVDMSRIYSRIGPYTFNRNDPAADPAALTTYLVSRPFLEFHLRRRVATLSNVLFLEGRDVGDLLAAQPERVTGVTVHARDAAGSEALNADLIIDATGRATRTPFLLERLGYTRPSEQTFTVDGVYYSQQIAIPDQDDFRERMILVLPEGKAQRGGLVACENNRWTLTIASRADDLGYAPTDFGEMLTLAEDFVPAHIQQPLRRAQPLTEVSTYRYPGGVWRRYDRMTRYPKGLLVIGDALCCLDPINGQGMAMATLHAHTLRTQLRRANPVDPQAFYTSIAAVIKPVWAANAEQPSGRTPGRAATSLRQRAVRWSRRKILEAAVDDIVITERLMRVANLIDPPQRLLEPKVLAHVVAHHARQSLSRRRTK
ncbi:FAD-dependent oxidoreductase [Mycolicibacterium stellerae]|uniref:FAD-dependent oxidoreductase n=1 Tax=Mycolicibacterium stellerae TaxID=2358193 RepID=UPI0013DDBC99|nr:FAD-dependent monooxygenase [Mycolicibacterium stellerae]